MSETGPGRVILAATPLGQPGDASQRLRDALSTTPVVAAEDTRRLSRLCRDLELVPAGRMVSFFEGNEGARVPMLIETLQSGLDVLVVTDAGMPSVSDPGFRLVVAAIEAGVAVTALPGPSAVTTALVLSGLPVDRFCFEGFLPRKSGARRRVLAALAGEARTLVFFEAPHRLAESLADLVTAFGPDRPAAVCRELTKTYEEVRRGRLAELAEWAAGSVRGEITVVVGGALADESEPDLPALVAEVAERVAGGALRKDAIADVAMRHKIPKRLVFDALVAAKQDRPSG